MEADTCNPSILETESGDLEFKTSLESVMPCGKKHEYSPTNAERVGD